MRASLLLLALVLVGWLLNVFLPAWVQRRQRAASRVVGPTVSPVVPRARPLPPPRGAPPPSHPGHRAGLAGQCGDVPAVGRSVLRTRSRAAPL